MTQQQSNGKAKNTCKAGDLIVVVWNPETIISSASQDLNQSNIYCASINDYLSKVNSFDRRPQINLDSSPDTIQIAWLCWLMLILTSLKKATYLLQQNFLIQNQHLTICRKINYCKSCCNSIALTHILLNLSERNTRILQTMYQIPTNYS